MDGSGFFGNLGVSGYSRGTSIMDVSRCDLNAVVYCRASTSKEKESFCTVFARPAIEIYMIGVIAECNFLELRVIVSMWEMNISEHCKP